MLLSMSRNTVPMMLQRSRGGKPGMRTSKLNTPLIVDDTGFFIDALNGFPGPYAAYVLNSIGNAGILKLMEGISDRNARFTTGIAYADERGIRGIHRHAGGNDRPQPPGEQWIRVRSDL